MAVAFFWLVVIFLFVWWRNSSKRTNQKPTSIKSIPKIDQSLSREERFKVIKKSGIPLGPGKDLYTEGVPPSEDMLANWERIIILRGWQNNKVEFKSISSTKYLKEYSGKTWDEILGELTAGVTLFYSKQTCEVIQDKEAKQALGKMLACCKAELDGMYATGQQPAPAYFNRAAILFRKAKLYKKEIQICELYIELKSQYCDISKKLGCSKGIKNWDVIKSSVGLYQERIEKAKSLLAKQRKKTFKRSKAKKPRSKSKKKSSS